jgi:hypothetical protein
VELSLNKILISSKFTLLLCEAQNDLNTKTVMKTICGVDRRYVDDTERRGSNRTSQQGRDKDN